MKTIKATMPIELHVMKAGHRCRNPYPKFPASNIIAGEMMGFHNWALWYRNSMYYVGNSKDRTYSFSRFDCAAAKLHELGKAHASNNIDSFMTS